jgi:S1-C subfamily serine protease
MTPWHEKQLRTGQQGSQLLGRRDHIGAILAAVDREARQNSSQPIWVIRPGARRCEDVAMLIELSNQIADVVERAGVSVVQVQGHRAPASGVVVADNLVLTTARAVGRADHPRIQRADGHTLDADIAGLDPSTRLVLLRVPDLNVAPLLPASAPRVGQIAIAAGRSWSNVLTVTTGLVSVIGGPLPTGRHRQIDQVIRTSAPMHEGFAGGALLSVDGHLLGVATAAAIRGLGVVIPASIAWTTAEALQKHGTVKRGYLGIAAQPVQVTEAQRQSGRADTALLVMSVKEASPAAQSGVLVGDLLLSFDGHTLETTDDLLDLLVGDRVGRGVPVRLLRGNAITDLHVNVGERG